jgi:hypothetical protein
MAAASAQLEQCCQVSDDASEAGIWGLVSQNMLVQVDIGFEAHA